MNDNGHWWIFGLAWRLKENDKKIENIWVRNYNYLIGLDQEPTPKIVYFVCNHISHVYFPKTKSSFKI